MPESGSFINGIVDSVRIAIEKQQLKTVPLPLAPEAARTAVAEEE